MLLAPATAHRKEKCGGRTAMPMQHVDTLQVTSHKCGQPIYSSKAAGAGFYSREKRFSQGWVLEFGHLSSGVAALQAAVPCLDLALSTIEG